MVATWAKITIRIFFTETLNAQRLRGMHFGAKSHGAGVLIWYLVLRRRL